MCVRVCELHVPVLMRDGCLVSTVGIAFYMLLFLFLCVAHMRREKSQDFEEGLKIIYICIMFAMSIWKDYAKDKCERQRQTQLTHTHRKAVAFLSTGIQNIVFSHSQSDLGKNSTVIRKTITESAKMAFGICWWVCAEKNRLLLGYRRQWWCSIVMNV